MPRSLPARAAAHIGAGYVDRIRTWSPAYPQRGMDFVGRTTELAALEQALAAIERGGAPGIGKTRLLAELAALADARGHIVLAGAAGELEQDLPFWVFVDALDEYVEGLDPRRL